MTLLVLVGKVIWPSHQCYNQKYSQTQTRDTKFHSTKLNRLTDTYCVTKKQRHTQTYTHTHARTDTRTHRHTHIPTHTHTHTHAQPHKHSHIHTNTQARTYTHTHKHTQTHTDNFNRIQCVKMILYRFFSADRTSICTLVIPLPNLIRRVVVLCSLV